jgi:hypothetical protein
MTAEAHRAAAEAALAQAQTNPVMSANESFLVAQVHALLAIEARLGELVDEQSLKASFESGAL